MAEPLAYIITGALMECSKGVAIMPFNTNPRTTTVGGIIAANESDKAPFLNIPSFVMCTVGKPKPCTPVPVPVGTSVWKDTGKEFSTVAGLPPVLFRSCADCAIGGKISFLTTGQMPMSEIDPSGELQEQIDSINSQAQEMKAEYEAAEDAVGEAGLVEGFIPVWGSGRDAINSFQQGNWGWGLFNSAMVVADVFTLGGASLVKGGVRAGVKVTVKEFAEGMAKKLATLTAAKAVAKEAVEKGFRESIERLARIGGRKLVTACFPAGTPVAVEGGFKNIEDIKKGDLVWSYNPDTLETGLKEVVATHQSTADSTIQLSLGDEIIETTASHPFYTESGWKNAEFLNTEDKVRTKEGRWEKIKSINLLTLTKKVYNFTVKDWHTYFVGAWAWLVHNGCFSIDPKKFDYFFGRVTTGSAHNIQRSAQNLADLTKMGVTNEAQLMDLFKQAADNPQIAEYISDYGTTITRRVNVGDIGALDVKFFYEAGDLASQPRISSMIPKIFN